VLARDPDFVRNSSGGGTHTPSIASVCFEERRPIAIARFHAWLSDLASGRWPDLFRVKGLLWVAGESRRMVVQGSHADFGCSHDRPWRAGEEICQLVLIGRSLDAVELRRRWLACFDGEEEEVEEESGLTALRESPRPARRRTGQA
jgi:G3E family GTPase